MSLFSVAEGEFLAPVSELLAVEVDWYGEQVGQSDQHEHNHVDLDPASGLNPRHCNIQEDECNDVLEDIHNDQTVAGEFGVTLNDVGYGNVGTIDRTKGHCLHVSLENMAKRRA